MSADLRRPIDGARWWRGRRFFRAEPAAEVDDELSFHLEMRVRDLVASGMSPEEARAEAARRFGDLRAVRQECRTLAERRARGARRDEWWQGWLRDLQVAARGLQRRPGLAAGASLTLALAIGVATTVFAVADALLLQPYPSPVGRRLLVVAQTSRTVDLMSNVSIPTFRDLLAETSTFEDGIAFTGEIVAMRAARGAPAERRFLQVTAGNPFGMLRTPLALGRAWTGDEDRRRVPVIVLAHRLWESRFGGDPGVVGRTVDVSGVPFTVIGVTARDFKSAGVVAVDGYVPLGAMMVVRPSYATMSERRSFASFRIWLVRREGASMAQVARAAAAAERRVNGDPEVRGTGVRLVVRPEWRARPEIAVSSQLPIALGLFGALAALVLMAASVNVAGLALARAQARRGEMALRRALGASRARLGRLVAAESLLLGAIALPPGLALALWLARRLGDLRLATDLPIELNVTPGWRTVVAGVVVSLGAGLLAGLTPAFQAARSAPSGALRDEGRGSTGGHARTRLRATLVVAQLAASLVLLVCAALFVRSLRGASTLDPGFHIDHELLATTDVSLRGYDSTRTRLFYQALLERVRAIPGVRSAALASEVPQGYNHNTSDVFLDDARVNGQDHVEVMGARVSAGYLETLGIPLREGRDFGAADTTGAPRVVIVSEAAARLLWPGTSAVGRQVRLQRGGPPVRVIGVARDVKQVFLGEAARPFMYLPLGQEWREELILHVHTAADPGAMAMPVRAAYRALDPSLPVYDVRTMEEHMGGGISFVLVRLAAAAATGLGLLGLVLTIVGVYGVVSYGVAERTREFGVRMALGAEGGDLLSRVLRDGLVLLVVGTVVGGVVALGVTRAMASILMGVSPHDAIAYAGALAVLGLAVLAATWIPARRASRLEPVTALRG